MQIVPSSNSAFLSFGTAAANNAPAGLMTNPDFNTGPINGADWMCTGDATIANGKANFPTTNGGFFYLPSSKYITPLVAGNKYVLAFYVNTGSTGSLRAVFNAAGMVDTIVVGTGLYSFPFTYGGGDSTFNLQDYSFIGSVEWCQISPA